MDKRDSEDISSNSIKPETKTISEKDSFASLVNEGFRAGQRIAKISVITLVSIGIAELLMGYISRSIC